MCSNACLKAGIRLQITPTTSLIGAVPPKSTRWTEALAESFANGNISKAGVCKTPIRRFDSDTRLQPFSANYKELCRLLFSENFC